MDFQRWLSLSLRLHGFAVPRLHDYAPLHGYTTLGLHAIFLPLHDLIVPRLYGSALLYTAPQLCDSTAS